MSSINFSLTDPFLPINITADISFTECYEPNNSSSSDSSNDSSSDEEVINENQKETLTAKINNYFKNMVFSATDKLSECFSKQQVEETPQDSSSNSCDEEDENENEDEENEDEDEEDENEDGEDEEDEEDEEDKKEPQVLSNYITIKTDYDNEKCKKIMFSQLPNIIFNKIKLTQYGCVFDKDLKTFFCPNNLIGLCEYLTFNNNETRYIFDCYIEPDQLIDVVSNKLYIKPENIRYKNKRDVIVHIYDKIYEYWTNSCCGEHKMDNIIAYTEIIPEKYFGTITAANFMILTVKQYPRTISLIPEEFKSYALCSQLITTSRQAYYYLKKALNTFQETERESLIQQYIFAFADGFYILDDAHKTTNIIVLAMSLDNSFYEILPEKLQTFELSCLYLLSSSSNLSMIPKKYLQNEKLFIVTLQNNGLFLDRMEFKYKTRNLCTIAVENNCRALNYAPFNMIDNDLIKSAINGVKDINDCLYMSLLIQDKLFYMDLIKKQPGFIQYLNGDYITHEILVYIMKTHPEYVSSLNFTNYNIINLIKVHITTYIDILKWTTSNNTHYVLESIPTYLYSREAAIYAICQNAQLYKLKFEPYYRDDDNFKTRLISGGTPIYVFYDDADFLIKVYNNIETYLDIRHTLVYELPSVYINDDIYIMCINNHNYKLENIPPEYRTQKLYKTIYNKVLAELTSLNIAKKYETLTVNVDANVNENIVDIVDIVIDIVDANVVDANVVDADVVDANIVDANDIQPDKNLISLTDIESF